MKNRFTLSAFFLLLAAQVQAGENNVLLSSLAKQLKSLRALAEGTATHAQCPFDTKSLIGLTQQQVSDALGQPDFIEKSAEKWSYFFSSPVPFGQMGGGFPELNFTFTPAHLVTEVSCHYSK